MNKSDILELFDDQIRENPHEKNGQRVEKTPHTTRIVGILPGSEFGSVVFSQLDDANAYTVIRQEISYFENLPGSFEWKLYDHDEPSDLGARLQSLGFAPQEHEALLYFDLEEPFPELSEIAGLRIRRISRPDEFETLENLHREIHGVESPLYLAELKNEMARTPEFLSIFVAFVDEKPVAMGWIRYHGERLFCDLWGGSTLPEYRKRGIYRALVSIRLHEAKQRGMRFVTTDAMPTSRPTLQKMGFHALGGTVPYLWEPE